MEGTSREVISGDGTVIATVTDGSGPPLLLVHGGMTSSSRWEPLWPFLTTDFRVTAMDRRGRGGSGDHRPYLMEREYDDVRAVAEDMAREYGGPVDVFGHSIGAVCVLGAAARGAPFRRVVLDEPPGPETVDPQWIRRITDLVAAGETEWAVGSFLIEVIGLAPETVMAMRGSPVAAEAVAIAEATMAREADALAGLDLAALTSRVRQPVLLLLGGMSPPWAHAITDRLATTLGSARVVSLHGVGHEAVDTAPERVAAELARFFAG